MGQKFCPTNLDKKEYVHPHDMDDGYKLLELNHTLEALAILLANSDDHPWSDAPMLGRWAGDRVVLMGEYEEPEGFPLKFTKLDVSALKAYLEEE